MNVLLVYMVNPQNQDQASAFLIERNGRELSPESGWWRIETELSFKHTFLQLWYGLATEAFFGSWRSEATGSRSRIRLTSALSYSNRKRFLRGSRPTVPVSRISEAPAENSESRHVRKEHHHRARTSSIGAARNQRSNLPLDNVVG